MTFDEALDETTLGHARWVRAMRIDEARTWRWIAEEWSRRFARDEPCWDFYSGQLLCQRAAAVLGERASGPPWDS
jgi:hypothetical protein